MEGEGHWELRQNLPEAQKCLPFINVGIRSRIISAAFSTISSNLLTTSLFPASG